MTKVRKEVDRRVKEEKCERWQYQAFLYFLTTINNLVDEEVVVRKDIEFKKAQLDAMAQDKKQAEAEAMDLQDEKKDWGQ